MLLENNRIHEDVQKTYTATLEVPQFIKLKESQYLTFKNKYFDFNESHYYLKDTLYKVTLKKHGDAVYLSKEIIKK